MVSKNNLKMIREREASRRRPHYGLRKLSVGVASVLLGTTLYFGAAVQTVHADTSDAQAVTAVVSSDSVNAGKVSSANSQNANTSDATTDGAVNAASDDPASTSNPSVTGPATVAGQTSTSDAAKVTEAKTAPATRKVADTNVLNVKKAQSLPATPSAVKASAVESPQSKVDVSQWTGQVVSNKDIDEVTRQYYELTGYTGDKTDIIVPNEADFTAAGKSTNGLQVGIAADVASSMADQSTTSITFSNTDGEKIKALGSNWQGVFSYGRHSNINSFNGMGLDVSNITNFSGMFNGIKISDLTSLTDWDVSNGTNFADMFDGDSITDLSPLADWNVSNSTSFAGMFSSNNIKDLSPLTDWDVSNSTSFARMFSGNNIKDLSPLANWNISNSTSFENMFAANNITDLSPLADWDVSNSTNFAGMFINSNITNLQPLADWDVSNSTSFDSMFAFNDITDLQPLADWDVSNGVNFDSMFRRTLVTDLRPLANWNVSNGTDFSGMFTVDNIIDLTPLANWNVSNGVNLIEMFYSNPIIFANLSTWNFSKVVEQIPNMSPLSTGLTDFIGKDDKSVILLGDNSNLPAWLVQEQPANSNNSNVFSASNGGHVIVTTNSTLLANPNKAFNKLTITDQNGIVTTYQIPVFVKASSLDEARDVLNKNIQSIIDQYEKANHVDLILDKNATGDLNAINGLANLANSFYVVKTDKATATISGTGSREYNGQAITTNDLHNITIKLTDLSATDETIKNAVNGFTYHLQDGDYTITNNSGDLGKYVIKLNQDTLKQHLSAAIAADTGLRGLVTVTGDVTGSASFVIYGTQVKYSTREIKVHYVYGDKSVDANGNSIVGEAAAPDAALDIEYSQTNKGDKNGNVTLGQILYDKTYDENGFTNGYKVVTGKWTSRPTDWSAVTAEVPTISGFRANTTTTVTGVPTNQFVYPGYNSKGTTDSSQTSTAYTSVWTKNSVLPYEATAEHTVVYMPIENGTRTITVNYRYWKNGKDAGQATSSNQIQVFYTLNENQDPVTGQITGGWIWNTSAGDKDTPGFHVISGKWNGLGKAGQPSSSSFSINSISIPEYTRVYLRDNAQNTTDTFSAPNTNGNLFTADTSNMWTERKDLTTYYVPDEELNRTITRIIKVKDQNGKVTNTIQKANFTRNARVNSNDDGVVIGYLENNNGLKFQQSSTSWNPADSQHNHTWEDYDIPQITDYTSLVNGKAAKSVSSVAVSPSDSNQTVMVTYISAISDVTVNYVDGDDPSNVLDRSDDLASYGRKIYVGDKGTYTVDQMKKFLESDGLSPYYQLDPEQGDISYTVTANGTILTVKLHHKRVIVSPNDPKTPEDVIDSSDSYPSGVAKDDLNQTITRTINVTDPHKGKLTPIVQTAHISRNATIDMAKLSQAADDVVTYGDWSTDTTDWADYNVPAVDGYTPSQAKVDAVTVADGQKDVVVNITYTANDGTQTFNYTDDKGEVIGNQVVNGKTDQTVNVTPTLPAGWILTDDSGMPANVTIQPTDTPISVKIQHGNQDVQPTKPVKDGDKTPTGKVIDGGHQSDLNQTITRTINVIDPHEGALKPVVQTAHITRTGHIDLVTGHVTYDTWSTDTTNWTFYTVPTVAGYTPSQDNVDDVTVVDGQKDVVVNITYTANDGTQTINYADDKDKVIGNQVVNGKTDQKVDVTPTLPAGWTLAKDSGMPTNVTIQPTDTPISVKIQHGNQDVRPTEPVKDGDKTPTGKVIDGGHETDLNQTIVRTITVNVPHQKQPTTITQVAKISRVGHIDTVTGHVTYGVWSTDDTNWKAYTAPVVDGYTASQAGVDAVTVKNGQKNISVNITYTQNTYINIVSYINEEGDIIKTEKPSGIIGASIVVTVPVGYHFKNGKTPTLVISKNGKYSVSVVKDKTDTGDPMVIAKEVANRINFVDQNGKTVGTKDITGEDGSKVTVNVPDGYHVDNSYTTTVTINAKNPVQKITVTANKHDTGNPTVDTKEVANRINFVDENGKNVGTKDITGKDGDKVTVNIPDGYHVDGGRTIAVTINVKNPIQKVTVTADKHDTGNPTVDTKDVANRINFVDQNGKTVGTKDITGKDGDKVTVNIPDGYHVDGGRTITVTINVKDPIQKVTVTADKHDTGNPTVDTKDVANRINFVDQKGKTVGTKDITGKDGDKVVVNVPDGYHVDGGQTTTVTISVNTPIQNVSVAKDKHDTGDPTTDTKQVANIIEYVDDGGKVIKNDLVTGKDGDVKTVKVPKGYHTAGGNTATVTIDAQHPSQQVMVIKDQTATDEPTTEDRPVLNIIQFVDGKGNVIETTTTTGKDGDVKTVKVPKGYHTASGNTATVTIDAQHPSQQVTVIKDQTATDEPTTEDRPVLNIIQFVDGKGNVIETTTTTGKDGDVKTVKVPKGYHTAGGNTATVTIDAQHPSQQVTVVKNQTATDEPTTDNRPVLNIIQFIDQGGKQVSEVAVHGQTGDKESVNVPNGYHTAGGNTATVTIDAQHPSQQVTVVKDQTATDEPTTEDRPALNIIQFVDGKGNVIETTTATGKDGDVKTVKVPKGYHTAGGNTATVTIDAQHPSQQVTVIKDQVTPDKPAIEDNKQTTDDNSKPGASNAEAKTENDKTISVAPVADANAESSKTTSAASSTSPVLNNSLVSTEPTAASGAGTNNDTQGQLPQTGNEGGKKSAVGFALAGLAGLFGLAGFKKKRN